MIGKLLSYGHQQLCFLNENLCTSVPLRNNRKNRFTFSAQVNIFQFLRDEKKKKITGTTVLGAFDPIAEIADVCHDYSIWLHVDAAWGGGALVSKKHKHLLTGIHRCV